MIKVALILAFLANAHLSFAQQSTPDEEIKLRLFIVEVAATAERLSAVPEALRLKCVHDGNIAYLICPGARSAEIGIDRNHIIGIIIDLDAGITESNLIEAPFFKEYIWWIASQYIDQSLIDSIEDSEAKATALIDERVANPNLPIRQIREDIIGVYYLRAGNIVFDPNENYKLFSKFGFAQLVPFIREKLYE